MVRYCGAELVTVVCCQRRYLRVGVPVTRLVGVCAKVRPVGGFQQHHRETPGQGTADGTSISACRTDPRRSFEVETLRISNDFLDYEVLVSYSDRLKVDQEPWLVR
ncbi:hypothetical protein GOBAR_AA13764 [Gossypium barbadense]|uniref:Uncharacterized protein n=1 Tax=Gossypium barbadense TaxID=3634 RepID=A0A2P5XU51_GOSBA|nr:hypothetical protein GOBAR_AA13764 [Gossypium barbadense]